MAKGRNNKKDDLLDIYKGKGIRKPAMPRPKVINPKKKYDRRDKSWLDNKE